MYCRLTRLTRVSKTRSLCQIFRETSNIIHNFNLTQKSNKNSKIHQDEIIDIPIKKRLRSSDNNKRHRDEIIDEIIDIPIKKRLRSSNNNKRHRDEIIDEIIDIPIKKRLRSAKNYKEHNEISSKWETFNMNVQGRSYVSPNRIGYIVLNDPFCTWYKTHNHIPEKRDIMYYKERTIKNTIKNDMTELNVLFKKGEEFEQQVYDKLIEIHGSKNVTYITKDPVITIEIARLYQKNVIDEIEKGTPFIFQVPLINDKNQTWGTADMIVRADYLDSLQSHVIDEVSDRHLKSNIDGHPNYYVIDIKWSVLPLRSDSNTLRNSNRIPVNKAQLTIYNAALGILQGHTPEKAFLLGKGWKREKCNIKTYGFSPFEVLGIVDFVTTDKDYIDITRKAIEDYHIILENGHKWKITDIDNKYLSPNMKNMYDEPYHSIKTHVSRNIRKDPTSIPLIGTKYRDIGKKNGILKFDDPNASAEKFGFKKNTYSFNTVQNHISVNRDDINILPNIITNNFKDWMTKNSNDIYVDFETFNEAFDKNCKINLSSSRASEWTFVIGVSYFKNNKMNYKSFILKSKSNKDELDLFKEFYTYIKKTTSMLKNKNNNLKPNIYHWGCAEMIILRKALLNKHGDEKLYKKFTEDFQWVDFLQIIKTKKSPLAVKGAFGIGLKNITNSLNNLDKISQTWHVSRVMSGKSALTAGANYYNYLEKKNNNDMEMESLISDIIEYNKIDCNAMYEVINYLRNNHTPT